MPSADKDVYFRIGYYDASGTQSVGGNAAMAYDVPVGAVSADFKLGMVVDNAYSKGCRVDLYVDSGDGYKHIYSVKMSEAYRMSANSSVVMWAENTALTIDNLKIGTVGKLTDKESDEPKIPTSTTEIYSQNFDTAKNAAEAGLENPYNSSMDLTVSGGKLNIPHTAWASGPYYTLVGNDVFKNKPSKYIIEMDVSITKLHVFGIVIHQSNSDGTSWATDRANSAFFTLRQKEDSGYVKGSVSADNDLWFRTGYYKADGTHVNLESNDALAFDIPSGATSADLKLTFVVNNTYEGGCRVDIFVDGEYAYTYIRGADQCIKDNSTIILWAEESEATIDNLKISTFN